MNTIPYGYQVIGARSIKKFSGRALLADDMGLGKSLQALLYLYRHPELRPAVVVCPASLKWNWQREARNHLGWSMEVLEGTKPGHRWVHTPGLLTVNYDILAPRRGAEGWQERLREIKPQVIILDECQYLQNRSAKRTKSVKMLCKGVPHVVALSGTPLTNRPAELWPVLNILRPDLFGNFIEFAEEFCDRKWTPWGWNYTGAKNLGTLHEILKANLMIRRLKKDVLKDLPGKSSHILPLPLSDRKQYEQAHKDFLIWLAEHRPDRIGKASKAEQLVKVGYLKRLAGELKLKSIFEWIDNFLEGSEEKLVVFGIHRAVISALMYRYSKCAVCISGETSARDRREAVERFQNSKKVRVFVGNIRAAGTGITLTASSTVLFTELDWTPGAHSQASDRVHRIGAENHCSIYYTIGQNTIEEKLINLLMQKQSVLDATLDGGESEDTEIFNQLIETIYTKEVQ